MVSCLIPRAHSSAILREEGQISAGAAPFRSADTPLVTVPGWLFSHYLTSCGGQRRFLAAPKTCPAQWVNCRTERV